MMLTNEQVREIRERADSDERAGRPIGNLLAPQAVVDRWNLLAHCEALVAERDNWLETARQHHKNEEYYRGLVVRIGETIGPKSYVSDDGSVQQDVLCAKVPELVESLVAEIKELERQNRGRAQHMRDAEQALGKALGYPWFRDDQKNFPGATEADGVCVGEHVVDTIAEEASRKITELRAENEKLRRVVDAAKAMKANEPGDLFTDDSGWVRAFRDNDVGRLEEALDALELQEESDAQDKADD